MKRPTRKVLLLATVIISIIATSAAISNSDPSAAATESSSSTLSTSSTRRPPQEKPKTVNGSNSSSNRKQARKQARLASGRAKTSPVNKMQQDPMELAQQQARLMMGYNNTPPLFLTGTRDFFVDVMRAAPSTRLTTIKAVDIDGDQLEYSLQEANLHDASSYFSINSTSGELKLAPNKRFVYHQDWSPLMQLRQAQPNDSTEQANGSSEHSEDSSSEEGAESDEIEASDGFNSELLSKNLYFLNVAVDDGHYTSVVELKIHVINSSSVAALKSLNNSPVQLSASAEGIQRSQLNMMRQKTEEYYDRLNKLTSSAKNASSSTIVYPNFVNPSIVKPDLNAAPETNVGEPTSSELLSTESSDVLGTTLRTVSLRSGEFSGDNVVEMKKQLIAAKSDRFSSIQDKQLVGSHEQALLPQPMIVSLVIACSALMIALVLLMFIVPLSVKRLRKRLKHVELQHEHLSQQNSQGSSIVCSSQSSTLATHRHNSSLSQFTLGSSDLRAGSSICRQSSLDSSATTSARQQQASLFDHRRGFVAQSSRNTNIITNPVYLHRQQAQDELESSGSIMQLQNQSLLARHIITPAHQQLEQQLAAARVATNSYNVYYPIEDELYSTISTNDTTVFDNFAQAQRFQPPKAPPPPPPPANKQQLMISAEQNYFMTTSDDYPQAHHRADSPANSDSGSSTKSLARFLSLPARHCAHHQQSSRATTTTQFDNSSSDDFFNNQLDFNKNKLKEGAKTIARTSHISKEHERVSIGSPDWELDRHKLIFLNILDVGQFGLVSRYKLKRENGREQIVAVKTLKKNAAKDAREREELLAEIEIMKLVCDHPNVVKILHCCTKDSNIGEKPILLAMEYVELGKLQSYLQKSRLNHHYATNVYNYGSQPNSDLLTSRNLIKFIYHVAKGMEYISSKNIIHRDLASRNILVSGERICKIGDFGMARHMQSSSGIYERHSRNTKIPVRWMAPEVLLNNRFTTKSDVYSFGILMWEIVTLGSTPYKSLKTEQVMEEVARKGQRPDKPEYCHKQVYEIMAKCWSNEAEERPTFKCLVKQLDELLLSANDYIELDQYPDHNYYNIPKTLAPYELL